MFSGEDSENFLDDWLPALVRAAAWNGWTKLELLIQLAGHMKSWARQEWSLLLESEKSDYEKFYKHNWIWVAKPWLSKTFAMPECLIVIVQST